jgi:LCP family protein required for cell wall assembly
MSDEPREPEDGTEGETPGDGEAVPPPPSTYAGRTRAEREARQAEQPESDADAGAGPEADPVDDTAAEAEDTAAEAESSGLTEEFRKVEEEMQKQIAAIQGGEVARADHEVVDPGTGEQDDAEPDPADELAVPPDEFAFGEDGGEEDLEGDEDAEAEASADADEDSEDADLVELSPEAAAAAEAGHTVEADTLSLADREAAKEAAMAGLRARTKVNQGAEDDPGVAKDVPKSTPAAAKLAGDAPPPVRKLTPPPAVAAAATADDEDPGVGGAGRPPKRRSFGWRFVAAASLVIMSVAAATAINSLLFLDHIAKGLGKNDQFASIQKQLEPISGGGPQTIMFLGSDSRAKNPDEIKAGEDPGRSDTTLLARIDPDKNTINLLSLPRDLKVNIPGYGVDKLNAAYSYGGQDLTLKTVKNLLGIDVNHVVNINFDGFYDAVNAIDCVYIDVDHHYFHSNEGLDPSEYYDEIDVKSGYQRLCGYQALNYVRYRHDDNDLIRGARQQDFIRELRQRIPPEKVFDTHLQDIFTKYTTSDITSAISLLEVLKTLFNARGASVHQIPFEFNSLGDATDSYVTATSSQIEDVRNQLLGDVPEPPSVSSDSGGSNNKKPNKPNKPKPPADPGTVDVSVNTEAKAKEFLKKKATDFPVFYPTQAVPGATLSDDSRAYPILGPNPDEKKVVYRGYKMVFSYMAPSYLAYYGVEGTNWQDPPILDEPTETKTIDGRDYLLFYDGGDLRLVGFKTDDGSYWVNNTLTKDLTEAQMMSIAESLREVK